MKKNNSNDWKRYLVCGICWINDDVAINTRQLRILLGKSKSTINGAFAKMGYETMPFRNNEELLEKIPFLRGNFNEKRQWTVRRLIMNMSDCAQSDATVSLEMNSRDIDKKQSETEFSPLREFNYNDDETKGLTFDKSMFEDDQEVFYFTLDDDNDYHSTMSF